MGATNHEYIRTIKRIAARQKIPGLSDYMSAVKTDKYMAKVLAPVILSCIAKSEIQKDAESHAYASFILEDVVSILQHTDDTKLPTLRILEFLVGRQILFGCSEGLETIGILPNHLLDRFKEQDVLDNIRFRLRLPDPPSLDIDEKAAEETEVASRIIFTFLRAEFFSHTVLAVTTLRHNSCDTLFFFCHSYPEQQIKPVEQRLTSVFKYIFKKTGVCIRSLTATFPKPARKLYIRIDVQKSAYRACRVALVFVQEIQRKEREAKKSRQQSTQSEKEAQEEERNRQLEEREAQQREMRAVDRKRGFRREEGGLASHLDPAGWGEVKKVATRIEQLVDPQVARRTQNGSIAIPKDFMQGTDLSLYSRNLTFYMRREIARNLRAALISASSLKTKGLAWGHLMCSTGSHDMSLVNLEGLEELVKEDGNTEEGDKNAERHEDFVDQEQNLDEPNALLSDVLTSEIEDIDEENDSETESLVSSLMGELINKDSMHNVDATEIETNDTPDYDTLSDFDDLSADEVEARVMKLLTPEQIKNSRLTLDEVDAYLDSIGPKIPFKPPSGKGTLNHH